MPQKKALIPLMLEMIAAGLLILAILLPRLAGLGRFVTPDEYMWVTRSANFYSALISRDFADTFQVGHPGVTIMWAGMGGFLSQFPEYADREPGQVNPDAFHRLMAGRRIPVSPLELLRTSRMVVVFAHTVILIISYLYARRLFGTLPALTGFLLIAFDPFHLGLTRLLHLDGLMANLVLLSMLAYLAYLSRRRPFDLVVAGIAAGLGCLTKITTVFLLPVVGLLAIWQPWQAWRRHELTLKLVWRSLWPVGAWLLIAGLTFVIVWPAMWVHPIQTLMQVFGTAESYAAEGHASAIFFNGQVIPDGNLGLGYAYFYPLVFLWRVTPIAILGLGCAAWGNIRRHNPFDQPEARLAVNELLLMVVIYTLLMTLGEKKFDRYLIPVYPALELIAGLGWYALARFYWQKWNTSLLRYVPLLIAVAAIALQASSALRTFPYYLSYYNPMLGGSGKAPQVMQIGWGEGLDQAARYLNEKPNARQLKVISWYASGSFSYFFTGGDRLIGYANELTPEMWKKFITSDYAVIYISQWQRGIPKPILDYVSKLTPEHSVWINGLEYARIYKLPESDSPLPES